MDRMSQIKKMNKNMAVGCLALSFLASCSPSTENRVTGTWQTIKCREESDPLERKAIYRAYVPSFWTRQDPSPLDSLIDTKKPLCEFHIVDKSDHLRLT